MEGGGPSNAYKHNKSVKKIQVVIIQFTTSLYHYVDKDNMDKYSLNVMIIVARQHNSTTAPQQNKTP
jgi:hypothetical protein